MPTMLVMYYSRSGNTEKMAELVAEGAREESGVQVDLKPLKDLNPEDMLDYDAIVMGSPVYYGTMAAELKSFIDESVSFHGKMAGKVGGAFASSGGLAGGNETTVLDILKVWLVHGMVVKGEAMGDHYGPVAVGAPDARSAKECKRYGKSVAALTRKLFG